MKEIEDKFSHQSFKWGSKEVEYINVPLEIGEKTELDRKLELTFGTKDLSMYDHITRTYYKAIAKYGQTEVNIITNLVPEQVYKDGAQEINIINK